MDAGWVPEGVDVDKPSVARTYDYVLGGFHNFAIDRQQARAAIELTPHVVVMAQANRAFLHRAVRFLVEAGVRQFLDLGSGIPTVGNVHEIAQLAAPESRVVYVDIDPVAVAHSRQILAGNDRATAIQADLRDPARILADEQVRHVLDFSRPMAILVLAVLHYVSEADDPYRIMAEYRDTVVPDSYLVVSHGVEVGASDEVKRLTEFSQRTPSPLNMRTPVQVEQFFTGCDLVPPGLVWAPQWHPDSVHQVPANPEESGSMVAIGRKR